MGKTGALKNAWWCCPHTVTLPFLAPPPLTLLSSQDKSFEAHLFLSKMHGAKLVRGDARNVVRVLGEGEKGLMSLVVQEPAAFEALCSKYGEVVQFEQQPVS